MAETWSREFPTNTNGTDSYYFVRRLDGKDVVVMGFSMGKAWLNGVAYEPSELRSHAFLGPLTPEHFTAVREAVAETWKAAIAAARKVGDTIATGEEYNEFHGLIVDVIEALESAAAKGESKQ